MVKQTRFQMLLAMSMLFAREAFEVRPRIAMQKRVEPIGNRRILGSGEVGMKTNSGGLCSRQNFWFRSSLKSSPARQVRCLSATSSLLCPSGRGKNAAIGAIGGLVLTWVTARTPGLEQFVEDVEDAGAAAVDGVSSLSPELLLGIGVAGLLGGALLVTILGFCGIARGSEPPNTHFRPRADIDQIIAMSTLCLTFDAAASPRGATTRRSARLCVTAASIGE